MCMFSHSTLFSAVSKSLIYTHQDHFISWLCELHLSGRKGAVRTVRVRGDQAEHFYILHIPHTLVSKVLPTQTMSNTYAMFSVPFA